MKKIGFTTSIPVEIIYAAGQVPVDLNNLFINSSRALFMLDLAEEAGYPRNTCGWIKGLYTAALETDIQGVIAVMQGDCSNTQALMETLQMQGREIIPFAYPYDRDPEMLRLYVEKLMAYFSVNWDQVLQAKKDLDQIRQHCRELDRLTWQENVVTGAENHYFLVSSSDFLGQPQTYEQEIKACIQMAREREPNLDEVRLAYMGVPPIFTNLYESIEAMGARIVYNEVQHQFSMPHSSDHILDQYLAYTYPYGAFARLKDILPELEKRNVDGIIHYTQTFCFRQIEDIIYRSHIKKPFLTLEGDKPGKVDARTRMRLESFVNMLKMRGKGR